MIQVKKNDVSKKNDIDQFEQEQWKNEMEQSTCTDQCLCSFIYKYYFFSKHYNIQNE